MAGAIAYPINYQAPSHCDDDFHFSIQQLNVENWESKLDNPVAQHFCFTKYGFSIALCPGDVLLFNSTLYHCISKKNDAYKNNNVHSSSLYLKTAHVGGQENTFSF